MGMHLEFSIKKGRYSVNRQGPRLAVDKLVIPDTEDSMPFVLETIKILRRELEDKVPLIGFSGAPFTLAYIHYRGGSSKNFSHTKRMMYQNPGLFNACWRRSPRRNRVPLGTDQGRCAGCPDI